MVAQLLGDADAKKILDYTFANGGGTFTPNGIAINPSEGYAVSLNDDMGTTIPVEDVTRTALSVWAARVLPYITQYNDKNAADGSMKFIGTWIDGGVLYLDVATVIRDMERSEVMALAARNNQMSVYDFGTKSVIWVRDEVAGV